MPGELIADGVCFNTGIAITYGKVQGDDRVATKAVCFDKSGGGSGCSIGISMPGELVADGLGFNAGIGIVYSEEKRINISADRALLRVVVSICAR